MFQILFKLIIKQDNILKIKKALIYIMNLYKLRSKIMIINNYLNNKTMKQIDYKFKFKP